MLSQNMKSKLPPLPSNVGKRGKIVVPPNGEIFHYTITDEIRVPQTGKPEKVLCLQHIEFQGDKRVEVRLGYYIIGKKPKMSGKWVWGQFAALMPLKDFKTLVQKAVKKGWI